MEDLEGRGVARISGSDVEPATCKVSDGVYTLSNESLQVKVGSNGRITSIVDLREECVFTRLVRKAIYSADSRSASQTAESSSPETAPQASSSTKTFQADSTLGMWMSGISRPPSI